MGRLLEIVTPLRKATKRDFLARMNDDKTHCMVEAKEYEFDYRDGAAVTPMAATSSSKAGGSRWRRA
jgi:hypothetical protein